MSTEANKVEKVSYKQTLNLPQTPFPMEAKLTTNEPLRLAEWENAHLYERIQRTRAKQGKGKWILHDGPPFANGDIHIGHVINKTLKDVILKFRSMQGYQTPYVPGWDCHGLPIEHKIQEEAKEKKEKLHELGVLEVRRRCFEYAQKYVGLQCEQFKRLGILGEWKNPYLTMKPSYECNTLEVFAKFVEAGLVYRKLKPVPWSIANQTALADAELEYQDKKDQSVYVEFELLGEPGRPAPVLLIWTTTPWTLPANMAIAVHADVDYAKVKYARGEKTRTVIVATDLVEKVFARAKDATFEIESTLKGSDLAGMEYRHPFVERVGRVVLADYVTTTDGTGLVHTATGHGEDDYETGIREKLEIYSPVLANGRYDDTVPEWLRGKTVWEGNKLVIAHLAEIGHLFAEETITHSYPHDWRSKTPIIFRATEQWFVAMDKPYSLSGVPAGSYSFSGVPEGPLSLRERAQTCTKNSIEFVPKWGQARLAGMLDSRPDWCVSRQRAWGLPIPVFYNEKGDALLTPASVRAVAKRVEEFGSDVWFTEEPGVLLGSDFIYPDGFTPTNLRKEKDIFDVWFESGSSWHAVLQARSYLHFPADLYLEGSDQHRGWFQLSLLPALGATGQPPFKQVLTHGFVVKPDGTKVSKSDKEYVKAVDEINRHGADVLRLWCCSVDYQNDIPASPKALQEFGDKYRKIRNTLRYLLSNLYDFNAITQSVEIPPASLDGWALDQMDELIKEVTTAYDTYQLHRAFRLLHDFCSVQISSVYGNAMKDRLYCEKPDALLRRQSQTVMYKLATTLCKLLAPMIVFTADEAWCHLPHKPADEADLPSVHVTLLPEVSHQLVPQETREDWQLLMQLRESALGQLDELKKTVGLNKASEAEVIYHLPAEVMTRLSGWGVDLEDVVGAGNWVLQESKQVPSVKAVDARTIHAACARCWKRRPGVDATSQLCERCINASGVSIELNQKVFPRMDTIASKVLEQRRDWTGRWCWPVLFSSYPWNTYAYFRRMVDLPGNPRRVVVRVSADALYILYVNGQRVHQGPARCYPGNQAFDTLDLTGLFHAGTNVIGAIAHQFGAPTFQRVFRDASGFLLDGIAECEGGSAILDTPIGWLARDAKGWRKNVSRNSIQLSFQEHFDADADPPTWLTSEYDANEADGWKIPTTIGPVGMHPWLLMEPRGIPLLADHVESLDAVIAQFRGENPRGYKVAENVYYLVNPADFKKDNSALENPAAMLNASEDVTIVPAPPEGEFIAATLDLGTYRSGHIVLDIADAAGDEFIDILFCEEIEKSQLPLLVPASSHSQESPAMRYRCRPGAQKWETFHPIGMRYLLMVFRNVESKPLKIRRISIRQIHTAFEGAGSFECSDERLNEIWKVGRNTQLNCSFDAFVDCPWREMAMWWGDARVQSQVTRYAFGDTSLLERGIRVIAQSQSVDGALHAHAPTDVPRHRLPDFMMTWVGTLWDHYELTGRTDLMKEQLPVMHRVFEFLQAHESRDGLIGSFEGYWMFLDWVDIFKGDYSAPFNLLYLQALRWAAKICDLLKETKSAAGYESSSKRVEAAIEKNFWDAKAKVWRDGFDVATQKPVEKISQHTNTLAILLGLKPETHGQIAREVLLKSAKSKRTKITTASSFFYAYVLQAMASQGLLAEVVEIIKDKWGTYFIDDGATTFYELWEVKTESRCHAWSASPVYHLMQIVLGVRPMTPGWTKLRIAPSLGELDFARGVVPTPRGPLRVEWEKVGDDQLAVRLDVPEGLEVEFVSPDGRVREIEAGANEFHT